MIVGLPCSTERLATLFDTAGVFSLYQIEEPEVSNIYPVGRLSLPQNDPTKKIAALVAHGVKLIICGGISQEALSGLAHAGIECIPWVCGETDAVLQAWCENRLDQLLMPGCRARLGLCPGGGQGRVQRGQSGACRGDPRQKGRHGFGGHNGGTS